AQSMPSGQSVVGRLGIILHEASEATLRRVAVLFEVHATAKEARRLDERATRAVVQDLARLGEDVVGATILLGQHSQLEAGRISRRFVGEGADQLLEQLFASVLVAASKRCFRFAVEARGRARGGRGKR